MCFFLSQEINWLYGHTKYCNLASYPLFDDFVHAVGGMGGYDALEGKIANFRMWNCELDINQLNALSCVDDGNLISQQYMDFTSTKTSQISQRIFPCGKPTESDIYD